ncbi:STAS domain-containing protein [Actinoplanes sp. NPDC026619]|uniref:STAS domain-containing protein n=1 Tax=Actinoplanes sp. NPDC026619 TaxID=3155798 RepID=UPI0033E50CDF
MTTAVTFTTGPGPDGGAVLAASGEIDMSNADAFAAALTEAREGADGPLVVDLTRVEYLDSAGLAALFPHIEHVSLLASPLLAPLLRIAGLADLTTIQIT